MYKHSRISLLPPPSPRYASSLLMLAEENLMLLSKAAIGLCPSFHPVLLPHRHHRAFLPGHHFFALYSKSLRGSHQHLNTFDFSYYNLKKKKNTNKLPTLPTFQPLSISPSHCGKRPRRWVCIHCLQAPTLSRVTQEWDFVAILYQNYSCRALFPCC